MDSTTNAAVAEPANAAQADAPAPNRTVDSLQKQLREKDQLLAALTQRLEQAAEQLDRLRRTGADKGHRPLAGGGSLPPELVQDQKQTLEELKKFVANWEQIQPGAALERIETQVNEIRGLMAGGVQLGATSGSSAVTVRDRPAAPATPTPASSEKSAGSGGSWWERQKAALLGEGPPPEEPAAPSESLDAAPAESASTDSPAPAFQLSDMVIPDPPPAVDFDTLTLDDAKQAIRARDQVIQQLREPLLLWQASGQFPQDFQSRDHLPPALRQRFEELESQWQAKFRQAELELSLERARLGREQAQVQQQQATLQKQIKQGGNRQREQSETVEGDDSSSRRRWFRFMGKSDESRDAPSGEQK